MRVRLYDLLPRGESERELVPFWLRAPALRMTDPDPDNTGGADDPTDDPDPDDTGDDPDDDDDTGDNDDPAALKVALAQAQARLKKANQRLAKREKPPAPPSGDDDAVKAATERAELAEKRALAAAGRAALNAAGVADAGTAKLLLGQLPALDAVEWDGDEPDLEDWLDEMQTDYPALFKPKAPVNGQRPPRGGVDQGAGGAPPRKKELSYGEKLLAGAGMGKGARRRG